MVTGGIIFRASRTAGAYSKRAMEHKDNDRHLDGASDLVPSSPSLSGPWRLTLDGAL